MKLFWKLFCSMVLLTVLTCSLGGYFLIDSQFRSSLWREVDAVYEENDLLRYALTREMHIEPVSSVEDLALLAGTLTITTQNSTVIFRISNQDGETVASNGLILAEAFPLTSQLKEGQRGWRLARSKDNRIFLHAASPLLLEENVLYLESCREVGELFTARSEQYQSFSLLMLVLTALAGMVSLFLSSLILRPLKQMTVAAKRMAAGKLHVRVRVNSHDELGYLAANFNTMAARLEEHVEELKEAAKRQEDFIGSFAHEIKTPLTSIIGYADLLRSAPSTPEQVFESADYIFREGRRLEALSRKLMDLIVLDRQDFSFRPVSMEFFLKRVGGALQPALSSQGIYLRIQAEAGTVPMEPDLMETVCLNLLDNARKAMDYGGIIFLEGFAEDDGYCVRVTDNGKGIPAGELTRITEAFYMVDKSRSRAKGGAGLGLAVCQRILSLHGGTLEFQSTEGSGTRVSVHLKALSVQKGEIV